MHKYFFALVVFCSMAATQVVEASSGGSFAPSADAPHKADQQYELGKSYYKGAQADGSRLVYCIKDGDKLKSMSRRTVTPFKQASESEFADSLYSCADPSVKITDLVADEQWDAILYYLNKRFKLRLK